MTLGQQEHVWFFLGALVGAGAALALAAWRGTADYKEGYEDGLSAAASGLPANRRDELDSQADER